MLSRFNARLNDVYCMKRDDVKALATWIMNYHDTDIPMQKYNAIDV